MTRNIKKRIAILFPGQGSQHASMIPHTSQLTQSQKQVLDEAKLLFPSLFPYQMSFDLGAASLEETRFVQPAMLLANHIDWIGKREGLLNGNDSDIWMAGHSLGEYSALVAAGWLSFVDAFRLCMIRGRLMGRKECLDGCMMVVKCENTSRAFVDGIVKALPRECNIAAINSHSQLVISGPSALLNNDDFIKKISAREKVISVKRLKGVQSAFHSPQMQSAQSLFEVGFKGSSISSVLAKNGLLLPVISNVTAIPHTPETAHKNLILQMTATVQWNATLEYLLVEKMCDEVVFCGPAERLKAQLMGDRKWRRFVQANKLKIH